MVCFEYDRLFREDFEYKTDFDFLLEHDFACLQINFAQGCPYIYVRHYLAVIALPSGSMFEILPKISVEKYDNQHSSTPDSQSKSLPQLINRTRLWVQNMLSDTLHQVTQHPIDTVASLRSNQRGQSYQQLVPSHQNTDHLSWYAWLCEQYIQQLQALHLVMPRHYATQQCNSPQASGKLNIKAQIRQNWYRPHYIASEQVSLVDYELLWQFLLTAYRQIIISDSLVTGLTDHEIILRLQTTRPLDVSQWQSSYVSLTKDILRWRQQLTQAQLTIVERAIEWAWWLMQPSLSTQQSYAEHSLGNHTQIQQAFMLNMNHLFEQWVGVIMKRWCDDNLPNSHLLTQPSFDWLVVDNTQPMQSVSANNELTYKQPSTNTAFKPITQRLRPDYCIVDTGNNISHVIEVKYKQLGSLSQINASDLYQMSVYQQYLGSKQAWIIYPRSHALHQRVELYNTCNTLADSKKSLDNPSISTSTSLSVLPFCVHQAKVLIRANAYFWISALKSNSYEFMF